MQAMRQNRTPSLNKPAVPKKMEGRKVRVRDVSSRGNYDCRAQPRAIPERKQRSGEQRVRRRKRSACHGRGRPSSSEATPARRATQLDPSLLGGRAGRLRRSWFIRGWSAGRTVHQDGEGRLDGFGLMDSFATAVSLALQYGVPLRVLCDKFSHTRFEPSGWSGNPTIGTNSPSRL